MRLYGVVALLALLVGVSQAQEIGLVTLKPNPKTGELFAQLPSRPQDEQVFILREGKAVATGKVKQSGPQGGTIIAMAMEEAAKVRVGDRISLTQNVERPLPESAFKPLEPTSLDAPAPASAASPAKTSQKATVSEPVREHKEPRPAKQVDLVQPVSPRLTPRSSAVRTYPAPAVAAAPQAGVLGPYGPGLAAAAPVGTPYLRSPAFAGPPVIYMPQTVNRVLLPGLTPYPSNIMHPPAQYVYASAPFTRTDIYVDLPYGTFYWPQGYAGTAPVEPQVPAYAVAPSTAIMTNEANYAVQRYDSAAAHPETLNPVSGAEAPAIPAAQPPTGTAPAGLLPGIQPPAPEPGAMAPPSEASPLIPPPAPLGTPVPPVGMGMPEPASPFAPGTGTTAGAASANAQREGIVVDDSAPEGIVLEPQGQWQPSRNPMDSYLGSSMIAVVDGKTKTATFKATVPEEGDYEVFLWWVASNREFRSSSVPVTVFTATGPVKATIDQTTGNRMFNSIGTFRLKAAQNQPVVSISTEGVPQGPSMNVSIDAVKLVKVSQ